MGNNLMQALGSTYRTAQVGVGTVPYDSGNTKSIDLPVTALQKNVQIRLQGNLVIATAAATDWADNPIGLLKKVEIVADGRRTVFSASGRMLAAYSHFSRRRMNILGPNATGTGTQPFNCSLLLDHEAQMFFNPVESLFDSRRYKTLQLRITWGAATDIAKAGGGGTIAVDTANTFADVMVTQTVVGETEIMFDHLLTGQTLAITATNPRLAVDVPQTGLLAGILIQCTRENTSGPVMVDDLVNSIALKSDTTVAHAEAVKWRTLQAKNAQEYQLNDLNAVFGPLAGTVYLKLHENGMFSSALNVAAINKTQLILDVTRTGNTEIVEVLYDFYEPLRAA